MSGTNDGTNDGTEVFEALGLTAKDFPSILQWAEGIGLDVSDMQVPSADDPEGVTRFMAEMGRRLDRWARASLTSDAALGASGEGRRPGYGEFNPEAACTYASAIAFKALGESASLNGVRLTTLLQKNPKSAEAFRLRDELIPMQVDTIDFVKSTILAAATSTIKSLLVLVKEGNLDEHAATTVADLIADLVEEVTARQALVTGDATFNFAIGLVAESLEAGGLLKE